MNPARFLLQYSSRFMVPPRLCSTTCRELERPSTPASTLGLAEASMTQSQGARASMSLAARTSPCASRIPRRFSSARFPSLPGRMKLSSPQISYPRPCAASARAIALPAKPQIPEIRIRTPVLDQFWGGGGVPEAALCLASWKAFRCWTPISRRSLTSIRASRWSLAAVAGVEGAAGASAAADAIGTTGGSGATWTKAGGLTPAGGFVETTAALRMESCFLAPSIETIAVSCAASKLITWTPSASPPTGIHSLRLFWRSKMHTVIWEPSADEPASSKASAGALAPAAAAPSAGAKGELAISAVCPKAVPTQPRAASAGTRRLRKSALKMDSIGGINCLRRYDIQKDTSNMRSAPPGLHDLPHRLAQGLRNVPRWEVVANLPQVGIVADMVAGPVLVHIGVDLRPARE